MAWQFWRSRNPTMMSERTWLGNLGRYGLWLLALYVLVCTVLMAWWSLEPRQFDVHAYAREHAEVFEQKVVMGTTTTTTLYKLIDTLLNKPGGYTVNDRLPPGVIMDNMPEWEYGVVLQVRDMVRALKENFSRSQSQSSEDPDILEAEGRLFFNHNAWILPQTEEEYRRGRNRINRYLTRLSQSQETNTQFYARSDNLQRYLQSVEARLGDLSQRLSASVGKRALNTDLAGDPAAGQATAAPSENEVKTPWMKIDNVVYEARGQIWALLHLLRAIEHDFGDVLDRKAARVSLQQIIRELEPTQDTIWSPMILNGKGLGLWANHSLVIGSYISRANAAVIDLRTLLAQG